jgi:transposase
MQAARNEGVYEKAPVLFVALELSSKSWVVQFGDGRRRRRIKIAAGDLCALGLAIEGTRSRWHLDPRVRVISCYEAGRDGFWIHRALLAMGLENHVVESSSIEVDRRARRVKTDRVDAEKLLQSLMEWHAGNKRKLSVVRVPSVEAEDLRMLHRHREHAKQQRTRESNRIRSLLATQGIAIERISDAAPERLRDRRSGDGRALGEEFKASLAAAWASYRHFNDQVRALEAEQLKRVRERASAGESPYVLMQLLMQLKSIGLHSAWPLVMELFGWRKFANRREIASCVGLTPMPYQSGASQREQGISKAGSRRLRALLVELSWMWLRLQPDSELSRWFRERFGSGQRSRKVGIVALARKLLIALWRLTLTGEIPAGARLRAA